MCGQSGHGRWGCTVPKKMPNILQIFYQKNNLLSRERVFKMLITTICQDDGAIDDNDNRTIFHELPKKVTAIVLHKKWNLNKNHFSITNE